MRAARVSSSTLRRLEALENQGSDNRPVAMWPKLLEVDVWSSIATNMQAELKGNIKKDCAPSYDEKDLCRLVLVSSR